MVEASTTPVGVLMDKILLRQQILEKRKAMTATERMEKQDGIVSGLLSLPQMQRAQTVFLYLDFRGEVSTDEILRWGWNQDKTMAIPVTVIEKKRLIPVAIRSFDEVRPGAYGIREPIVSANTEKDPESCAIPAESIDVVIVPGVAFDPRGGRLGYGGGYYDRFLPKLRTDVVKIGLAFELQVVDQVPVEEHDIHLDFLVTEKRVIDCKANT